MTEEQTRAAIYAAMADEDSGSIPEMPSVSQASAGQTYMLELNGARVELVTVDYARRLEQTINAQARVIQQMQRQFARVASTLRDHRQTNSRIMNQIGDVARDLDYKIDRRD